MFLFVAAVFTGLNAYHSQFKKLLTGSELQSFTILVATSYVLMIYTYPVHHIKSVCDICQNMSSVRVVGGELKQRISLVGKHIYKPSDLSSTELKSLLWTAFDLKKLSNEKWHYSNNMQNKLITLILRAPSMTIQTIAQNATNLFNMKLNTVIHRKWDVQPFIEDTGKYLSFHSNLLICQAKYQFKLDQIVASSNIPIICVNSCKFNLLRVLSDIMTVQEHFGYLKDLNFAFIGPACCTINTFLCIAPRLGVNINYYCSCNVGALMSPVMLPEGKKVCAEAKTKLNECKSLSEAIEKADVIITTNRNEKYLKINMEHLKKANKKCILLNSFPRGINEIDKEVFENSRNKLWESSVNSVYILGAMILRLLEKYDNVTAKPDYENIMQAKYRL